MRSERALLLALAEMYVQCVPTRRVAAFIEKLCGSKIRSAPVSRAATLLDIALTYWVKRKWHAGESIRLWRGGFTGAFLKEEAGLFVTLNLTGYRERSHVFQLIPGKWEWEPCRDLEQKYHRWAARAQEALKESILSRESSQSEDSEA